jgi:hypothetical protein
VRLTALALCAAACAVWLGLDVRPVDLAASDFRATLFDAHGFTLWDGQWYGGHYTLTYSVIAPPLTALFGSIAVAIASALAAAALFADIAQRAFGTAARLGAAWFGLAAATSVFHGRVAYALGVALALAAVAALQRERTKTAIGLALLTGLASPVAALFLAIAALAARRLATAAAAIAPVALIVLAFPEDGQQTYKPFELVLLLASAAAVALAGRGAIRRGAVIYAAVGIAAYVVTSSLGNNVLRLAALFGGPLLACLLAERRVPRIAAVVVLAAFAYGQWRPAINDVKKVDGDPAATAAYYAPLNAFLEGRPGAYRTEIPFTRAHWEAAVVAPRHALARGWQRQLDVARNPLFYGATLDATTYGRWLSDNAVRYVALPDATLDVSSEAEGHLIEHGLPYLRPVWSSAHWRVYENTLPHSAGPVESLDGPDLRVTGAGVVKVRWSPYWRADHACVERAGDWTRVTGAATLNVDMRGDRCD